MPISRLYKLYLSPHRKYVKTLKNLLGFVPGNLHLYRLAFRHKSVAQAIRKGVKNSNERLEFLGDAVLGSVVAEVLFKLYPYEDEGFLTELRSKIVSRVNLNCQAQRGPDVFPFTGRRDSAEGTLSVSDALRSFSIRSLVATKLNENNKHLLNEIIKGEDSNFLSTKFIF